MPCADKEARAAYTKAYKTANRERISAYFHTRYLALRDLYIERAKARQRANPERKRLYDKKRRQEIGDAIRAQARARKAAEIGTAKALWERAKSRAKRDGIPFNISIADIVVPEFCPALGIRLAPYANGKGGRDSSPSLDRLIPNLGYIPGNITVISNKANGIKRNATWHEILHVAKWLAQQEFASLGSQNAVSREILSPAPPAK